MDKTISKSSPSMGSILLPLVLAQFVCSYAASNMNVAVTSIADDLGTSVHGVQIAITLFTLTMAVLMIPGSKLTDILGRKKCFRLGLAVYGVGALLGALAPGVGILIFGYSFLEGIGSALLIPPVYILATVSFSDIASRAKAFGGISAAAGLGAAAGPLIGGVITTSISWRASFILQVIIVLLIIVMSRRIEDPGVQGERPGFDLFGSVLMGLGLFLLVGGILLSGTYGWIKSKTDLSIGDMVIIPAGGISPVLIVTGLGLLVLWAFFFYIRSREKKGKEPLLRRSLFKNRSSNLGLLTQLVQWMILQGGFFVISVFLQTIRGYNAIQTGLILTPATIGILITSSASKRLASKYSQRALIRIGFILTALGMILLILLSHRTSEILFFFPGLFFMGLGVGIMLTSSVNVVQSSFGDSEQGEISGLSRSVSNLGSSFGTALVGSVLLTTIVPEAQSYGLALIVIIVISLIGLLAAFMLPKSAGQAAEEERSPGSNGPGKSE